MFAPLPAKFDFPESERHILEFWQRHDIFGKTLELRKDAPRFVFYEGPPTANGQPHPGHCLTRAMKDLFPRYQTMCGKLVERKAGWDTHGLPVEVEVCKSLGIHTKDEIEAYGVEKFVQRCIESVFKYVGQWEDMTRRLGFWVNLDEAYVTFHQSYVESVWWGLKTLFERGLLYQGHKVVWWWAQGGTALSAGEVGEGYRTVDDPSVFVKFPLVDGTGDAERFWGALTKAETLLQESPDAALGDLDDQLGLIEFTDRLPVAAHVAFDSELEMCRHFRERGKEFVGKVAAPISLLVWTTTPWTLVSNHFAAVHPELRYALVHDVEVRENLVIAADLVETIASKVKRELEVLFVGRGEEILRKRYRPPFHEVYWERAFSAQLGMPSRTGVFDSTDVTLGELKAYRLEGGTEPIGWRVVAADFVTIESGTGLVHEAPAYGEVDFDLLQQQRQRFEDPDAIPLLNAVNPDGTFNDDAPEQYRGRWVKDCDKEIIRELKERTTPWGTPLLFHQEQIRHEYPFCPRAEDDPLIQYARKSWFVRTSRFKDEFLANNDKINWLPEHIKEGRFGDFLRNNVDWALSRERYWGTPLPIWVCEQTGKMEAICSYEELLGKPGVSGTEVWEQAKAANPSLSDHLRVHKPYIDAVTYDSPFVEEPQASACAAPRNEAGAPAEEPRGLKPAAHRGARMRRVPEVIDCWWDAGSMPFAQWGFPHQPGSVRRFIDRFPAHFISEAIDQTRGWFYGLLAINTLLFSKTEDVFRYGSRLHDDHMTQIGEESNWAAKSFEEFKNYWGEGEPWDLTCLCEPDDDDESRSIEIPHVIAKDYPLPYRTCIVLGHMMGEDGLKMSKRTKNYKEPSYVFDTLGADAMRWYFFSAQTPWTSVRFQEAAIRDAQRELLVRLYNVFSFFNIYANIDGFDVRSDEGKGASVAPANGRWRGTGYRPAANRSEIDRWILSELHITIREMRAALDRFENYPAAQKLTAFVDALSNWYVRRCRDRFWRGLEGSGKTPAGTPVPQMTDAAKAHDIAGPADVSPSHVSTFSPADQDKWDAYNTLYECLTTVSRLIAPFTPFFAETMYQNLEGTEEPRNQRAEGETDSALNPSIPESRNPCSIHMCDYPSADVALIDEPLAAEMELVRDIASLGLAARAHAKLRVRQPLALVEIILSRPEHESWLAAHAGLITEELNVRKVEFTTEADHYVEYEVKPNFKAIGPKHGKLAPRIASVLKKLPDPVAARKALTVDGTLKIEVDGQSVELTGEEVEIRLSAKPGWSAAQGRAGVVVLRIELTDELREEGLIRELIHHVQSLRKTRDLAYEARIVLLVDGSAEFAEIVRRWKTTLHSECLATAIEFTAPPADASEAVEIEGHAVTLGLSIAPQ